MTTVLKRSEIHAMKETLVQCKSCIDTVLLVNASEDPDFSTWYIAEQISRLHEVQYETAHLLEFLREVRDKQRELDRIYEETHPEE